MTRLSQTFPKYPSEPSWDRAQVARALRTQRHRRRPFLKAAQVLLQWAKGNISEYDARDLEIIAELLANMEGANV